LRVLGFGSGHIGGLILGEAAVTGLIAGATGSALSYPIVELGVGRWLVENTSGLVQYFGISPLTFVAAILAAAVLAVLGAILPMMRALRVPPIDAVRRVA
jgi:putative ABC transport system permease protein